MPEISDYYFFGLFIIMLGFNQIARWLLPPELAQYAGLMSIPLLFMMLFGLDFILREMVNKYPYYNLLIGPLRKRIHVYEKTGESQRVKGLLYSRTINMAFPENDKTYGKYEQIKIIHEYPWPKRVTTAAGKAKIKGMVVDHPAVADLEVYPLRTPYGMQKAKVIPQFYLRSAPNDLHLLLGGATLPSGMETATDGGLATALKTEIKMLETDLANQQEINRQLESDNIELENLVEEQKAAQDGLLGHKGGVMDLALEIALTFYNAELNWKKVVDKLRGPRFPSWLSTPLIMVVAVLAFIAVTLHFNPQYASGIGMWMSVPFNVFMVVLAIALIFGIIYYKKGRK